MPSEESQAYWRMNPTERFSDRACDYVLHRPSYPGAAIDSILDGLGAPERLSAADIGAGTGISARLLGDRGVSVVAVEPNRAMREVAQPHPRVTYKDAAAERTGLADASLDVVLCAQAFHWFEPRSALAEFRRILRPGRRLALIWNERWEEDAFTKAYSDLVRQAAGGATTEARDADLPSRIAAAGFGAPLRFEFRYEQPLTAAGLIGRAASASYVPRAGQRFEALVRGLRELHARFADDSGSARLLYRTGLYLASRG